MKFSVVPGATLEVVKNGMAPTGVYPHLSEDAPIDPTGIKLVASGPGLWFGPDAPPLAATVAEAFEGKLCHNHMWNGHSQGAYVPEGARTRSLWGVACDRADIGLFESSHDSQVQLKAQLCDGAAMHQLPISSHKLKEAWRKGGITMADRSLPKSGKLHIRLGLARAFKAQPDKCYVMINGVEW